MSREFGDFQTPAGLADSVLRCLSKLGHDWARALEPTCGSGSFIAALLRLAKRPRQIIGIEIQDQHIANTLNLVQQHSGSDISIQKADFFRLELKAGLPWSAEGRLLVVGNPPWVTNAELGSIGSANLPVKRNLKRLRGIEAMTGDSNFDVAESIWLKLLKDLASEKPSIALLCKTAVARNVLRYAADHNLSITNAFIRRIDAKKWFGAAVDACLFYVEVGGDHGTYKVPVFPDLDSDTPETVIGIVRNQLIADCTAYEASAFADGYCPLVWRQGIKHDAAAVMELTLKDGVLVNGLGENIDVEDDYIFPLLKSSDLFQGRCQQPRMSVIVTQKQLGASTDRLEEAAPKLWSYLQKHLGTFRNRKSSIYANQPDFCLFGIGDYSYAPYKVAISGLYKTPRFRTITPVAGRPVMLDDTCYFFGCSSAEEAFLLTTILNDSLCLSLLGSLIFSDSKRPVTKKLLQRIDLRAIVSRMNMQRLYAATEHAFQEFDPRQAINWQSITEQTFPPVMTSTFTGGEQSDLHALWR